MARAPLAAEIDELPEADRLDGFPHPRETARLVGQDAAERQLAEAFASGRMHHGWILSGREGIGKATLAYRLAAYALAAPHERDASLRTLAIDPGAIAARQVRALSHPGLLVLRRPYDTKTKRFAASIPVDEVRRLRSFLGHRAAEGAWRVVIVDDAGDLNANAANALLKSLEEPPPRTLFLLVTSEPGRLLVTIRSRCRVIALQELASGELRDAVVAASTASGKAAPAGVDWDELARLARGSVRRALSLSEGGGLKMHEKVGALLAALPKVDWGNVHQLGDELAGSAAEQKFELFFELLENALARMVRAQATGEGADADQRLAARLIGPDRLASWAALWETVVREKAVALALNLDRKTLILETMSRLESAARQ